MIKTGTNVKKIMIEVPLMCHFIEFRSCSLEKAKKTMLFEHTFRSHPLI